MAKTEEKMPVYDDKVNEILRGLNQGKSREEISEILKYSTWRSLDIYMRRKNFIWDGKRQNYIPATTKVDSMLDDMTLMAPAKVSRIISLFKEESPDPKSIARQVGFVDHMEMAGYLRDKGFVWSQGNGNYVEFAGEDHDDIADEDTKSDMVSQIPSENVVHFPVKRMLEGDVSAVERFLPLLDMLENNRNRLLELLTTTSLTGTIPRYTVPGTARTKSVYMSEVLCRLAGEFSKSKNVTQREIMEGALLEYLKRYGYEHEIDRLLKRAQGVVKYHPFSHVQPTMLKLEGLRAQCPNTLCPQALQFWEEQLWQRLDFQQLLQRPNQAKYIRNHYIIFAQIL